MPLPRSFEWTIDRIPQNRRISYAYGLQAYAVDGQTPRAVVFPNTVEEMSMLLAAADAEGKGVVPWGGGTAMGLGNLARKVDLVIGTSRLNRVLEHEPADLTVVVEGGTTLGTLQEELGRRGQFLPLDPPLIEEATIGGVLASNASGPWRTMFGTARDRLIGIKVVHPNGEVTKGGGKVVKNVSGYDMDKLYTGSLGTLGIIVEAAFKVAPRFKDEKTLLVYCPSLELGARLALEIPKTGVQPVALQLLDANAVTKLDMSSLPTLEPEAFLLALALGGTSAAVARQEKEVRALAEGQSTQVIELPDLKAAGKMWSGIRDMGRLAGKSASLVAKSASLPTEVPAVIKGIASLKKVWGLDCGVSSTALSGVTYSYWWAKEGAVSELRSIVGELRRQAVALHGHCVVESCPTELKSQIDVWGVTGPETRIMKRIKEQFDPRGTLNLGRFVDGI